MTELPVDLKRAYKICDIKSAFGDIFSEEVKNYDFWGHCDMDVRSFMTADLLNKYDMMTTKWFLLLKDVIITMKIE